MISYTTGGGVQDCKVKMFMVLYTTNTDGDEVPVRYCEGEFITFDESQSSFTFEFKFRTNDQISDIDTYMMITKGLKTIGEGINATYAVAPNMKAKFFILAKLDTVPTKGRVFGDKEQYNLDEIIPNLNDYTLTNVYNAGDAGIDFFYDYSDISYSYIDFDLNEISTSYDYEVYKIPVVRYTYMNTEQRIRTVLSKIELRRRYINSILSFLENSFGIDYKLFNTYGPSVMYNIDNKTNIDRVNISLYFEIKFQIPSEKTYLPQISNSIKEYIEDLNYITDLHIPNLITYITNTYREQLTYIKLLRINDYGSLNQSIYKNPEIDKNYFLETQTVPEFINVNTLSNDLPDINFKIIE